MKLDVTLNLSVLSPGEILITVAHLEGEVIQAFLDNAIYPKDSPEKCVYNPDLNTWVPDSPEERNHGLMNGTVNQISRWGWGVGQHVTSGIYVVETIVYSDIPRRHPVISVKNEIEIMACPGPVRLDDGHYEDCAIRDGKDCDCGLDKIPVVLKE